MRAREPGPACGAPRLASSATTTTTTTLTRGWLAGPTSGSSSCRWRMEEKVRQKSALLLVDEAKNLCARPAPSASRRACLPASLLLNLSLFFLLLSLLVSSALTRRLDD